MGWTLQDWSNLGQAAGGFATVAGVFFAAWQLTRWRTDRFAERRGDAAAHALVSLKRNCNFARGWCSVLAGELRCDDPLLAQYAFKYYEGVVKSADSAIDELAEVQVSCVALLDENETRLLCELQELLNLFVNEMNGCFGRLEWTGSRETPCAGIAAASAAAKRYGSSFGELEAKGMNVLRPIAQLRARPAAPRMLAEWFRKDTEK